MHVVPPLHGTKFYIQCNVLKLRQFATSSILGNFLTSKSSVDLFFMSRPKQRSKYGHLEVAILWPPFRPLETLSGLKSRLIE